FQLLYNVHATDVAIVTNVTPNHLDFHTDYQEYIDSKKHLFMSQDPTGRLVLNSSFDITYDMKDDAKGTTVFFAQDKQTAHRAGGTFTAAYIEDGMLIYEDKEGRHEIVREDEIVIPGKHNAENYLAASCAVWPYVSVDDIRSVARSFPGVPHRIEFIREIDGVRFYNSSIDTSPNRTINTMNALAARGMKGVLITGGKDKKCDYTGLGNAILNVSDRIVIYGDNASFIKDILEKEADGRSYKLIELPSDPDDVYEFDSTRDNVVNSYKEAISKARELAKEGEVIIMSSVGTSYDHFRHFEHRGDMFRDLVNAL
ncbi:MAG: UDP-N-acetylmuramoyl-L-alanine--D-glutamate ligase, partial [Clostridiales bacterium]|nr:UDP-N-acetylmuramoyl-L-alanine--D-glutamate ligase [Clostridiales bacterium]